MNFKNDKTRSFTETILITTLMTLYVLLGIYFIPVITILYPIPFIILGVRHGIKYNLTAIVVSSILISILIEPFTGFFIFVAFAPLSISLAYMLKEKKNSYEIFGFSVLITIASFLVVIFLIGKISGVNFVASIDQSLSEALKAQINMLKDKGLSEYELYNFKDILKNAYNYFSLIIPSSFIIFSGFTAYINYLLSVTILRNLGYRKIDIPKLSYFRLPSNIILGTIVIFLAVFLMKVFKILYYDAIFVNVTVLASFVFFLQGFAVILFYINKLVQNKFLRVLLVIFTLPLGMIISFVGFLDVIFDFRKIKREI